MDSRFFGKCRLITEFEKLKFLGEGTYGSLYKVKDKPNDKTVALQKMKLPKDLPMPTNYIREITILKRLNHENIVNLLGIAVGSTFESTYLILDFCPYELSKVIDDEFAKAMINHSHIKCILHQLFFGLSYLHENWVLHRDLTVTNIRFTDQGFLKIAEFGNSRTFTKEEMTPNTVSRWYRAPELLFGAKIYTSAIDMWSAGCIFAELVLKQPLFKGDTDSSMISKMVDLLGTPTEHQWPGCSDLPVMKDYEFRNQPFNRLPLKFPGQPATFIGLLNKMLKYNPKARVTAERCLTDLYFIDTPPACSFESLVTLLNTAEDI